MEVYKYVNSKDVQRYLKDIKYQFSTLEAGWLIWQCKFLSFDERHQAWKKLMECMPDCQMPERRNVKFAGSFFEYITQYMDIETKMLIHFFEEKENCIFRHEAVFINDEGALSDAFDYQCYSSIGECFDSVKELYGDYEYTEIDITKVYLNGGPEHTLRMRGDKTIISVTDEGLSDEEEEIYRYGFDGMWFDIPTPFVKGDILYKPNFNSGIKSEPFVLLFQNYKDSESGHTKNFIKVNGDTTDMSVLGCFARFYSGELYKDHVENYLDLEYYSQPFNKKAESLLRLSKFVKGEIDIIEYSNEYGTILLK